MFFFAGKDAWIDIKRITDKCISQLNCPNGLTVSFWLNFEGGDYIISGGGYAGKESTFKYYVMR